MALRRDDATDGRAFLSGFHRHFTHDLAHEQIEFLGARCGIFAQNGGIEAIGLHREPHRIGDYGRMGFQHPSGFSRTGKGHRVLLVDMIE